MKSRHGFTLVELSIVLVILGLLVGGVLSGQSLIRAAELRSIVTEKDKTIVALNAFRDKYFAKPGDMKNAFAFWGSDCGTDDTAPSTGCNGDGNGTIDLVNGENIKAWEHLSRAGLIEGSFDGTSPVVQSNNTVDLDPANIPAAKYAGSYWSIGDGANSSLVTRYVGATHAGTILQLGRILTIGKLRVAPPPALTLGETWNLDTKSDDGRAQTGRMRGGISTGVCDDFGTDYYGIAASGPDAPDECLPNFLL